MNWGKSQDTHATVENNEIPLDFMCSIEQGDSINDNYKAFCNISWPSPDVVAKFDTHFYRKANMSQSRCLKS